MQSMTKRYTLEEQRQRFPALANKTYFNFGGQGVMADETLSVIADSYRQIQLDGPFNSATFAYLTTESTLTRQAIAAELGCDWENIALTASVTEGCNIAVWGLDWQRGDRLVMTDCEHMGVIAIVEQLSRRFGVEIDICPVHSSENSDNFVDELEKRLTKKTRMVVLSHVLWNTGQVLPVHEIGTLCRRMGIKLVVDGAQSAGVMPLDLRALEIDCYAITGHKWLCGPEGIGALYVAPEAMPTIEPTFCGWRSITMDGRGKPSGWMPDASRYSVATVPFPLWSGLRKAIEVANEWGDAADRYSRILDVATRLRQGLSEIRHVQCLGDDHIGSGLVSFVLRERKHSQCVGQLESSKLVLRMIPDPNCLRASIHYLNTEAEIDALIEAVRRL